MEKEKKEVTSKVIKLKINETTYRIAYDGYSFTIFIGEFGSYRLVKYPSTLRRAIELIVKREHVSMDNQQVVSVMEFVDKYEKLINDIKSLDLSAIENDLVKNPVLSGRSPSEETKAKMKAAKEAKKELENNIPVEDDDEDVF